MIRRHALLQLCLFWITTKKYVPELPKAWNNAQGKFGDLIYCLFILEAREAASLMSTIQVLLVTGLANLF